MPLLLSAAALDARRAICAGPLAPLLASLRDDLGPVLDASVQDAWLPREKARLSRAGGVCPRDGTRLRFDPFQPHAHACPRCAMVYTDDAHYRWWIMGYQLWLAERAVHAATLHALGAEHIRPDGASPHAFGAFVAAVLGAYADTYLTYPNTDNVLGPTRPFFSTYLESLWLLHVCVALDLLESVGAATSAVSAHVRARVIEPSVALIASYDEGWSNRQVWNVAARIAAAHVLGRPTDAERAVHGPHGLLALMDHALLADGTWYEGENYHQFAHRGLWYAVTIADHTMGPLPAAVRARFALGFATPFRVALPDLTLPSRRDSQYAVSLRQWRWAEWCELGLAVKPDERQLAATLDALYAPGQPQRDVGRWRATGESERNEPAAALTRADLGWKSLLFARPSLPARDAIAPETVLEARQGFAVFRRERGTFWVGVDYGVSGGGHGHADRLNLTVANGDVRWLDDMGTGTYVERTLHWYRSTLAHQAPLVDGASQPRHDGELLAFDERGALGVGWVDTRFTLARHVTARRSVVVRDGYLVDVLRWSALQETTFDLPIHLTASVDGVGSFAPADPGGAGGLEDGHDFLRDTAAAACEPGAWVQLHARAPTGADIAVHEHTMAGTDTRFRGWVRADRASTWFRAVAPGPPGAGDRAFYFIRQWGRAGRIVSVWDARDRVRDLRASGAGIVVRRTDGGVDEHMPERDGWRVTHTHAGPAHLTDTIHLGGAMVAPDADQERGVPVADVSPSASVIIDARDGEPIRWTLTADHYLRSEIPWDEAGRPTARVTLVVTQDDIGFVIDVDLGREPRFVPADAVNALDNESPDVNSDGVQLLIVPRRSDAPLAWLLVPERDGTVRVSGTTTFAAGVALQATSRPRPGGFTLACTLPFARLGAGSDDDPAFGVDVAINECPPGRDRRRGQLRLSGADGDRVYLRGDRMDAARALVVRLPRP